MSDRAEQLTQSICAKLTALSARKDAPEKKHELSQGLCSELRSGRAVLKQSPSYRPVASAALKAPTATPSTREQDAYVPDEDEEDDDDYDFRWRSKPGESDDFDEDAAVQHLQELHEDEIVCLDYRLNWTKPKITDFGHV